QRVDYAARALLQPRAPLAGLHARIAQLVLRASRTVHQRCATGRAALSAAQARLERDQPDITRLRQRLDDRALRLAKAAHAGPQRIGARFDRLHAELVHLDPQAVLRRGYSVVRDEAGRAVSNAAQLKVGQGLGIVFNEGGAQARVESVAPKARLT